MLTYATEAYFRFRSFSKIVWIAIFDGESSCGRYFHFVTKSKIRKQKDGHPSQPHDSAKEFLNGYTIII